MGPVLGAALISGGLSYLGSRQSARMSQASAREQMAFQAEQTGTGYQRAVADMKKAGLNPMLAAKLGPAASASGAMAQIPDFGTAVQRGIQGGQLASAAAVQAEQAKLTRAQTEVARMQPTEIEARVDQIRQNISESEVRAELGSLNAREKRLLVLTLEAAQDLDPEAYKQLKFGFNKTLLDGLIETMVTAEKAMPSMQDVVKYFRYLQDQGENVGTRILEMIEELRK